MCGVIGTAPVTNRATVTKHSLGKALHKVATADWFWALCIVIGAIVVPAPSTGASTVLGLPKLCLFRNITGITCPGCGMTRSLISTAHLHFEDAVVFHPLGPPVLLLLIVYSMMSILRLLKRGNVDLDHKQIPGIVPILLALSFAIVWLARLLGFLPTPA